MNGTVGKTVMRSRLNVSSVSRRRNRLRRTSRAPERRLASSAFPRPCACDSGVTPRMASRSSSCVVLQKFSASHQRFSWVRTTACGRATVPDERAINAASARPGGLGVAVWGVARATVAVSPSCVNTVRSSRVTARGCEGGTTTASGTASSRLRRISAAGAAIAIGTTAAPHESTARNASTQATELGSSSATRRPGPIPVPARSAAVRPTRSPSSRNVTVVASSLTAAQWPTRSTVDANEAETVRDAGDGRALTPRASRSPSTSISGAREGCVKRIAGRLYRARSRLPSWRPAPRCVIA